MKNFIEILRELDEGKVFATGKCDTPGKCFRNVTAPSLSPDTVIGHGFVRDKHETTPHVFLMQNDEIHEPTIMKGQTDTRKGAPITHLHYKVLGKVRLGDLPNEGKDGMEQWKSRERALAHITHDAYEKHLKSKGKINAGS
jgi:hypothetical protein